MESCKHFLTDTEMENRRHRVFNFAMSSFDMSLLNDKLNFVFIELKCAVKVNLAFGFVLKNFELKMDRVDVFELTRTIRLWRGRNFCVHWTTREQTKREIAELGYCWFLYKERANTKWKFYKLTSLTIFAALLEDVPMGCKASVLPEPLLKNRNVKCLTFEKNTTEPYKDNFCLFRAFALHLVGNERLEEETSKILNNFLSNCGEWDPSKFQGVHMTIILKVKEMLQLNIFLYDIDFVHGGLIGELARRSIQSLKRASNFTRHELLFQLFSLPYMWHNLFKDWNIGATFDYM